MSLSSELRKLDSLERKMKEIVGSALKKYKGLSPVAKAPIWYAICSVIQNGIGVITMPIFTNILTTEQYGMFTIYQTWMGILILFTTLNLQYGAFNNAMVKFEDKRDEYISSMQGLVLTLNIIYLLIYLLFNRQLNMVFGLSTVVMLAMFLEMSFAPCFGFWSGKKRFEFKYVEVIVVTLSMAVVNPIIGVIAVTVTDDKGTVKIVAAAIVNTCFYAALFIRNLIKGKKLFVWEHWKYALSFHIPLIPYYLSQNIFNQSDRIMIQKMVGKDKAGIYGVVYNCSMVITFIITSINNAFVPWTYQKLKEKDYDSIRRVSNMLSLFIGTILLLVTLVAPEIISVLAADEYYEGIWTMPPIICSLFFLFQSQLFINVEFYKEKKNYLVCGSFFGAIVNIVLNYLLIPVFGYVVAGYTTLFAYIVFAVSNFYFMTKIMKAEREHIYDIRFLLLLSVGMIAMSILILLTYKAMFIRVILFVAIAVSVFVLRRRIIGLLKGLKS